MDFGRRSERTDRSIIANSAKSTLLDAEFLPALQHMTVVA
jgi:hypothetical protein